MIVTKQDRNGYKDFLKSNIDGNLSIR